MFESPSPLSLLCASLQYCGRTPIVFSYIILHSTIPPRPVNHLFSSHAFAYMCNGLYHAAPCPRVGHYLVLSCFRWTFGFP